MKTVISAAHLVTPTEGIESPVLVIDGDRVDAVGSREAIEAPAGARRIDLPGLILAPGLLDIHVHGGAGHDVMEADPSALAAMERHMADHGVTGYLPTTVTAPLDRTLASLANLGKIIASRGSEDNRARPLGIHLEGPFISHTKRGVHPPKYLLLPSPEVLDQFWQASAGTIRMMTIAPELPGAVETIRRARALGIHSSVGHSDASYDQTCTALRAGAEHATHTFNAMRALDHRNPGILGAVLTDDTISADIIADGVHVAPIVVRMFLAAKGPERAVLITDAISATGMPDGRYRLGAFEVQVTGDRCEHEGKLAGSVLTLDRAVRNVMSFAGWNLQQAIGLATLNPARLLGLSQERGILAPGRIADLVAVTPEGEVARTIVAGNLRQS
ncbi:MAG TPA: N-acetylglucosamine-6-phosphate deacetylase [Terriglobales bacterium]